MAYNQFLESKTDFCIYIDLKFFLDRLSAIDEPNLTVSSHKTAPHKLTLVQEIECIGVEEAYHYAQYTKYRNNYVEEMFESTVKIAKSSIDDYHNHPIEKDAEMKAVRPYLKEVYGLDKMPENNITCAQAVHMWTEKNAVIGLA